MKSIVVLTPLLLAALAAPVHAAPPDHARADGRSASPKLVRFSATASGPTIRLEVVGTQRFVTGTGSGTASHLGRIEVVTNNVVDLAPVAVPGCATLGLREVYSSTITAANGDTITLAGTGSSCPTSPTTAAVTDTATVTGGTGRFAGASGTITVRATVDRAARSASVTYDGTLSTPGSSK